MKVTEAFKGNFIEALHLAGLPKGKTLTIKSVADPGTVKSADKKVIDRPILYFEETDKGLILNKTNARTIGLRHGNEMNEWTGKTVTLFGTVCDAFGEKNVPCVRVRVPVSS